MRYFKIKIALLAFLATLGLSKKCLASDWDSSPNNWNNREDNWENSSDNWQNSPDNWENSPNNSDNDRLIMGNDGEPVSYTVEKSDGGVNIYDFEGNRTGYVAAEEE